MFNYTESIIAENAINYPMTDDEEGIQPALKCDIKIDIKVGKTSKDIILETARALRVIAAQIEGDMLEDGFHSVTTSTGEEIGEIYFDFYGIE